MALFIHSYFPADSFAVKFVYFVLKLKPTGTFILAG
jgi:hypothetical protein